MTTPHTTPKCLQTKTTPIAIIGMAALFPEARNLQEYWNNIIGKVDCISDVPASHWNIEDYYDPDSNTPDKTYAKRGGFLPEIDFDPLDFGLPPDTLQALDSAQLLSLVIAKAALDNAGYGSQGRAFNRETTGVILGASGLWKTITPLTARLQFPVWEKVLKSSGLSEEATQKIVEKMKLAYVPWEENSFPGMLTNVVAGRITNRLDLGGTNCVVDAACASSLSAMKMAISELIEGRCDLMITGGIDTDNSILNYMCFSKTPAFSKKDYLNPFDAESDGMMVGEGLGMFVLKRLDDAERDGDRIYAVIKGIGTSSDGRYKSIYAPRPEGQMKALRRAYENAAISPATVGLIEAHGTGTPAGDLCEFTSLNQVFRENNAEKQSIALGSVKSQIGHTKAAAGAASLMKVALSLYHKVLPPTINITQPNPKFKMEESPFYLNTEAKPWLSEENTPRRAGVSSFGFGGTNFHIVLEEYTPTPQGSYRLQSVPQSLLLSANTPEQLLQVCESVRSQLESDAAEIHYENLLKCKEAVVAPEAARVGFVTGSLTEAKDLLKAAIAMLQKQPQAIDWEHPKGIYYRQKGMTAAAKVVALFPGQGSQYLNMGREIALNFPLLQQVYQSLDELFTPEGLTPISQRVFPKPAFTPEAEAQQNQFLQFTENAQPAIGAFSVGLYKILQQAGFRPDFVAGHSFGEITALWAGGVLTDEDYFSLIKVRGQTMSTPAHVDECNAGTMLAVSGNIEKLPSMIRNLGHVKIANFNSPKQVVLSGGKPEIAAVQQILTKQGYTATLLPVSAAFHSPFVSHASKPFAEAIAQVTFKRPQIPVFTNTTGSAYPNDPEAIQSLLKEHILNCVQFQQEIENLYAQGGYCFVEIGPRQILTNLVKEILEDRPHLAIALNPNRSKNSDLQLRQAAMQLRVAGLPLAHLDPYEDRPQSVATDSKKGKSLKIRLNGSNYISEKTQTAFAQALQEDPWLAEAQIQPVATLSATPQVIPPLEVQLTNPLVAPVLNQTETELMSESISLCSMSKPQQGMISPMSQFSSHSEPVSNQSLENILTQFFQSQTEVLRVHEHCLKLQGESAQSFLQILPQLQGIFTAISPISQPLPQAAPQENPSQLMEIVASEESTAVASAVAIEGNSIPFAPPVEHLSHNQGMSQPETQIPSHRPERQIVVTQESSSLPLIAVSLDLVPEPPKAPELKIVAPPAQALENSPVTEAFLSVVSDKTGYPTEMLELEMDLEADLGIDSIKRVEIMGAVQEIFPQLPKLSPEELAEKLTLAQIAEYLDSQLAVGQKKIAA